MVKNHIYNGGVTLVEISDPKLFICKCNYLVSCFLRDTRVNVLIFGGNDIELTC